MTHTHIYTEKEPKVSDKGEVTLPAVHGVYKNFCKMLWYINMCACVCGGIHHYHRNMAR